MQATNDALINELSATIRQCTWTVEGFLALPDDALHAKKDPQQWNVLECLEHLNLYGDYYLPAIEQALLRGAGKATDGRFRSGWLGNYFANLMLAAPAATDQSKKAKKMKSPADKNPLGQELSRATVQRFLKQQAALETMLEQSRHADLTHMRVPISILPWLRLRLGDVARFVVYHNARHVAQAGRAVR